MGLPAGNGPSVVYSWDALIAPSDRPLYVAADHGEGDRVRQLLDLGADPNEANMHGWTAL
jgi:ankyrin repeat protein